MLFVFLVWRLCMNIITLTLPTICILIDRSIGLHTRNSKMVFTENIKNSYLNPPISSGWADVDWFQMTVLWDREVCTTALFAFCTWRYESAGICFMNHLSGISQSHGIDTYWRKTVMLKLLHMLDKWTEYLKCGGQTDAVYTDFEKAFDKVNFI